MTDAQKLHVRVLNDRGGEDHLGENDAALELEDIMAVQEVTEEERQCPNLLIAGGARWAVHAGVSLVAEDVTEQLEMADEPPPGICRKSTGFSGTTR